MAARPKKKATKKKATKRKATKRVARKPPEQEEDHSGVTVLPPPPPPTTERWVRATKMGYYNLVRRRPGDVFLLNRPQQDFSSNWMEDVDRPVDGREKITGAQAEIKRQNAAIEAARDADRSVL